MRHFRHEFPMRSPLGVKIRDIGFSTLWDCVREYGFTDLDTFKLRIGFTALAPVGFYDFLNACAEQDAEWPLAFRIGASDFLNVARIKYADKSPSKDWIVIHPVAKLASQFGDEVSWVSPLTFRMRDYLLEHRSLFDAEFHYNDPWLIEVVSSVTNNSRSDPVGRQH